MVRKGFESEVKIIRDEANDKIEWLSNNLFHPDFIKVANELSILTVKLSIKNKLK